MNHSMLYIAVPWDRKEALISFPWLRPFFDSMPSVDVSYYSLGQQSAYTLSEYLERANVRHMREWICWFDLQMGRYTGAHFCQQVLLSRPNLPLAYYIHSTTVEHIRLNGIYVVNDT